MLDEKRYSKVKFFKQEKASDSENLSDHQLLVAIKSACLLNKNDNFIQYAEQLGNKHGVCESINQIREFSKTLHTQHLIKRMNEWVDTYERVEWSKIRNSIKEPNRVNEIIGADATKLESKHISIVTQKIGTSSTFFKPILGTVVASGVLGYIFGYTGAAVGAALGVGTSIASEALRVHYKL